MLCLATDIAYTYGCPLPRGCHPIPVHSVCEHGLDRVATSRTVMALVASPFTASASRYVGARTQGFQGACSTDPRQCSKRAGRCCTPLPDHLLSATGRGLLLQDENFKLRHDTAGLLAMANAGPGRWALLAGGCFPVHFIVLVILFFLLRWPQGTGYTLCNMSLSICLSAGTNGSQFYITLGPQVGV